MEALLEPSIGREHAILSPRRYVADAVHGMRRARPEQLHGVRRRRCNDALEEPPLLRSHHGVLPGAFTLPALLGRRAHHLSVLSRCRVDSP